MSDGAGSTPGLHVRWTRLLVYWDGLQPTAPGPSGATYNQAYVDHLKMIVSKAPRGQECQHDHHADERSQVGE